MQAERIFDDNDDEAIWVESDWICPENPQTYPTDNLPPAVRKQREKILQLPPETDELIPHDFLPVLVLLDAQNSSCPVPRQDIVHSPIRFVRSAAERPQAIVDVLKKRPTLPPRSQVSRLEVEMNQAWFNGNTSLIDTYYRDYPLPFWVISIWSQLHFVHSMRMKWRFVEERVCSAVVRDREMAIKIRKVADSITEILRELAWHAPLAGFPSAGWRGELERLAPSTDAPIGWTTSFIQFFEDSYLNDEAINLVVADLGFERALLDYHKSKRQSTLLSRCEDFVKTLGRTKLFFIVNPNENHWAVIQVDFERRTRAYGDSLASSKRSRKATLDALDFWLYSVFPHPGKPFKEGLDLPCDRQIDGTSCGIAACTLISSQLGLDEPWVAREATLSRFTWAHRVMQIHQDASTSGYVQNPESKQQHADNQTHAKPEGSPTSIVPPDTSRRFNRMNLSMLVDNMPGNGPSIETSAAISRAQERSESPESPPTPDQFIIDRPLPYRSPSPIDTNNTYLTGSYDQQVYPAGYVERDGVLHFDDSEDEFVPGSGAQPPEIPFSESVNNYGKHPRHSSGSSSSETQPAKRRALAKAESTSHKMQAVCKSTSGQHSGPAGISKTARADRARLEAAKAGVFVATRQQINDLLSRARRKIDPEARLVPDDRTGQYLIHSICSRPVRLDAPLRTSKFSRHHQSCSAKHLKKQNDEPNKSAHGCLKLDDIFKRLTTRSSTAQDFASDSSAGLVQPTSQPPPPQRVLCRGLRAEHHEKVRAVLERSKNGGKLDINVIAKQEYNRPFASLSQAEKDSVRAAADGTAEWVVYLDPYPYVRHAQCEKICDPGESIIDPGDICTQCAGLLKTPSFQKAMNRPLVEDAVNFKYVPFACRNKNQALMYSKFVGLEEIIKQSDTGSRTPLMQAVKLVLKGTIQNSSVFSGLFQAIAAKEDKLARGKGLQGIRYPPGWIDFCNVAYASSPRAYSLLKQTGFPVLGERDLRKRRSRTPRLSIGVSEQTFTRAKTFLSTIGFTGPLRLWCLQAAAPKIPVLVLAAMPIDSSMKADNLFATHACLIKGLLDSGVCVSSYACDGSATERKVSRLFIQSANSVEDFVIPHPEPGFKPHTISLRFYGPNHTPIAVIQDSKHLAKTLRNVLFSGTHSLIIGNCVLYYQQILALSKHQNSPIFARDVTKVDRQDDLAALRLFSSATLKLVFQIIDEQKSAPKPDPILSKDLNGLAIYLFVFGELIDALQNRFMSIETRCKNVFRAYHFLEIWAASLDTLKYPKSAHFITREAREIIQYLVDGFISLVLIYRDHLDHGNYPLMPWLHSTEPCEHTFGEARKLESDITVSNFIYIQGKLKALFDAAVLSGEYTNANARAAGYFHTEYADRGIDIAALSSYPTSSIICESSNLGFYEAKALFALCGIPVTNDLVPPNKTIRSIFLPIDQWLPNDDEEIESHNAYMEPACEMYTKPAGVTAELHQIFQAEGTRPLGALRLEDKMDLYSCAAVALEVDNQNKIDALPDFDTEIAWQQLREQLTRDIPGFPLPPLVIADEVRIPLSHLSQCETNVDNLVAIRVSNETEFAKKAVRIGAFAKDNSTTDPARETEKSHLVGQKILAKIHETLREIQKTVGSGTGAARKIHHGQEPASLTQAGNAANAAIAAKERGATAMKNRVQKLKDAGVKCIDIVAGAGVSGIAPVRTGSFAVVLTEDQLWLAEVLTMYSKSAGKGGNHGWVDSETNVSQLSYILVQLWEHWSNREFRSVVKTTASYHAYRFAHIPSQRLLR
ncbi:hypothetical protein RhiJN_17521 [Ceratobasidium sp. AG-Ba]|nr:hypothetical protein RhiJN_17521 [Ceratobasidium sp. AG-Ba]